MQNTKRKQLMEKGGKKLIKIFFLSLLFEAHKLRLKQMMM